jgi:hypothetical protein
LRVSALRQGLMRYGRDLERVAAAQSLSEVAASEPRRLSLLETSIFSLAQLTVGARRRLIPRQQRPVPASGSAVSMLEMAVENAAKAGGGDLGEILSAIESTLHQELPRAVARAALIVLGRLSAMPVYQAKGRGDSFVPPVPKEAPLPPWRPGRRILGGFYVLRALGAGAGCVRAVAAANRAC